MDFKRLNMIFSTWEKQFHHNCCTKFEQSETESQLSKGHSIYQKQTNYIKFDPTSFVCLPFFGGFSNPEKIETHEHLEK